MPRCRCPVRARLGALVIAASAASGCGSWSSVQIPVGDAGLLATPDRVVIAVDPDHPALLRAVDTQPVAGIHVSHRLRAVTFLLPPGAHELWLTSAPYGQPLLPQRLKCFVLKAELSAGAYALAFDRDLEAPVLRAVATGERVVGTLVDEPWVFERTCRWR